MPRVSRPPLSRSSVTVSRATLVAGAGGRRDHRAEAQALRRGGDRRKRDPRVRHLPYRCGPAQAIPNEEPVPAGRLRLGRQPRHHHGIGQIVESGNQRASACRYLNAAAIRSQCGWLATVHTDRGA